MFGVLLVPRKSFAHQVDLSNLSIDFDWIGFHMLVKYICLICVCSDLVYCIPVLARSCFTFSLSISHCSCISLFSFAIHDNIPQHSHEMLVVRYYVSFYSIHDSVTLCI
jgi:hypothetical protein